MVEESAEAQESAEELPPPGGDATHGPDYFRIAEIQAKAVEAAEAKREEDAKEAEKEAKKAEQEAKREAKRHA